MKYHNRVKEAFANSSITAGIWNGIPDPYAVEICAGAKFDWVLIDGEHAPYSLSKIVTALQTIAAYNTGAIVRVPSQDPAFIKQILDCGAQNIMVPMINTKEEAESIVRAISYPPEGIRGVGTALSRGARWNRIKDYLHTASEDIGLICQIETVEGIKNLESIAAVDGIDCLFVGPADLAAHMGHPGNPGHPDVQNAILRALKIIKDSGKIPGILALREEDIRRYNLAGALFFGIAIDSLLLAQNTSQAAEKFAQLKISL